MKTRNLRAPLAALPLALMAAFSHAQTQPVATLPETVVTATRVAQPLTDVVADVTIIDRQTIERSGAVGLVDVLARVPGISFTRNGGPASTTSLLLRGAENRFTALYVDGVRVDSQSTGGASWGAIPLSQIDRIEVLRGPAAAVYGSDALAGVIQVFTRRGEGAFSPSLAVGVGSHGTRKLDAGMSGTSGAVDYALGLSREISKGFDAQPALNPDKDGYRNTAASASLGLQVNAAHRLEATALSSRSKAQYDDYTPGNDDWALQDVQTLGLSWKAKWSDAYQTRVSATQGRDKYETTPSVYLTDTKITSYLFHNEWRQGAHLVTGALERRENRLDNAYTTPTNTMSLQNALALGYGYNLGSHTLQLNVRRDDDSDFGGKSTGSAAYAYGLMPHWRATASVGTAFRAPTLFQRYSFYGVPSLRPESASNLELGVKYAERGNAFSVVVYRNNVTDLIDYVSGPGLCANGSDPLFPGCYTNTARARLSGVTLAGETQVGAVALNASLDLQDPKDLDTGKLLARRAKKLAKFGADTRLGGWKLGVEWQLTGQRFDDAYNTELLGGYGVVNVYADTLLSKDWSLLARIDNLGDKAYETAKGYATGGRQVFVGVKWAPN